MRPSSTTLSSGTTLSSDSNRGPSADGPRTVPEWDAERTFRPRGVAVYGASAREGTFANRPVAMLKKHGYDGLIVPVNPNHSEISGIPCYSSATDAPGPVDLAVITVGADAVPAAIDDCIAAGITTGCVLTAGFGDESEAGRQQEIALAERAREGGMRLTGPNSVGIVNVTDQVYAWSGAFDDLAPGAVSVVSQSGGVGALIMSRLAETGVGLDLWVSIGNEADLRMDEVVVEVGARPTTKVILVYIESLKSPSEAAKAFRALTDSGVTVLVLKPGRSSRGQQAVASHTGALASPDEYYDSLFRESGAIRVSTIDEMVDCAAVVEKIGRPVGRAGVITGSGGFCALTADVAESTGLELSAIGERGVARMRELVPFCGTSNPIDPTPLAFDRGTFDRFVEIVAEEPDVDYLVYCTAHGMSHYFKGQQQRISDLIKTATSLPVPFVLVTELRPEDRKQFTDAGIPVLPDAERAIRALSRITLPVSRPAVPPAPSAPAHAVAAAEPRESVVGQEAYSTLERAGVVMTPTREVRTLPDALAAAGEMGYPVVLKDISSGGEHKSESGGVIVGIASAAELEAAWRGMRNGADGMSLLQAMVTDGVAELLVGGIVDDQFGPQLMVGTGGIFAEVWGDTVIERAPVSEETARDMLRRLRSYRLLTGARGRPAADLEALVRLVVAAGRFIADPEQGTRELDINPVIARSNGALGVDLLWVRRNAG